MAAKKYEKNSEDKIALAKKRFQLARDAESEQRKLYNEDFEFRIGEQWPEDTKREREVNSQPCLVFNRLPQFIRQITNDQRQNRPSVKVNPVDDKADKDTARVLQGLIRNIEYSSNSDAAYDRAFDTAVTGGYGYFRVVTDYVSPTSFEQEIKIKSILNPNNVYLDPNYQEPDASDANWGFIFYDLPNEEYDDQYPDSEMCGLDDWRSIGDNASDWASDSTKRVAEYFYKDFKDTKLYLLSNGKTLLEDKLRKLEQKLGIEIPRKEDVNPEDLKEDELYIEDVRDTKTEVILWCKINGLEELESSEWAGKWIPIIPVFGDEVNLDGKRVYEGIVRHAKDPQRMLNYWKSMMTETMALAPRAPWIGPKGAFEGFEKQWSQANRKNFAYLEYNQKMNGSAPQRNSYEPPIQATNQAIMQTSDDLKASTGIYDSALGNQGNEVSGIAIRSRNMQSQTSNFHFVDNLARAQKHCGRILVDLIPKIYDTARTARIIGEDGKEEIVKINQVFEDKGQEKEYKLGLGKYDVTVSTGPSYQTKRQESVDALLQLTGHYPQFVGVAGDLLVEAMDIPNAEVLAERLKKSMPPELVADDENGEPLPPQAQQKMAQMSQLIEQLTQNLNEAQTKIDQKTIEHESKERIQNMKNEVDYAKIEAGLHETQVEEMGQDSRFLLQQEMSELQRRQDQINQKLNMKNQNPGQRPNLSAPANFNPTGGQSPGQPME